MLLLIFLAINVLFSSVFYSEGFTTNISMSLKYSILFVVFLSLMCLYKRHQLSIQDIEDIIKNNLYYGPLLLIGSSALGLGRSSYTFGGQDLGSKGVFLSLNSVNIALITLYIFCLDKIFKTKNKKWVFLSIYVAIPMAMLGTKTSYIMIAIIPILYFFISIKRRRTWQILLITLLVVLVLARPFYQRIIPLFQGVIDRQKLLYSQRDFWTYLTSTRNIRVKNVISYYLKHSTPISLLFGGGYYWIHHIAATMELTTSAVIPIEMDWADIFVTYGIIGLIFSYVFILSKIIKARKMRHINDGSAYFWSAVIILLYGTFAGHLLFEAISATFYGVILAGLCMANKEAQEKAG